MIEKRRVGFTHLVVLAFFAGGLAACGVKGDLERPPAASYSATGAAGSPSKVFSEESQVRYVPPHDILPKMPPEEWEKVGKDAQAKRAPKKSAQPDTPDRPFVLDGLL